jgi:hypothetical protein
LEFRADNTSVLTDSLTTWAMHLREPWTKVVTYFRTATVFRTLLGAFAWPWWALAAAGFLASRREDREWALAVGMAGLVPAVVLLSLLALSRAAYYMYPAVYLLAARGALALGQGAGSLAGKWAAAPPMGRLRSVVVPAVTLGAFGALALTSNLDLLGYQELNTRFHFPVPARWP